MTYDPETAERLADEIDNLCGFDAMADPQSVLMKAQELSDMIRAQAAEIARLKNALHVTAEQGNAVAKELAGRIHTLIDTPAPPAEPAEIDALREALLDAAAHLVAAISLLERGGKAAKKAAPSDKMFDQMLNDYRASADRARAALAAAPDGSLYGDYEPITVRDRTELAPQPDALIAAERRGAESMRERAAYEVAELFEHTAEENCWVGGAKQARRIAAAIRALPLTDGKNSA